jgi:CxxC-x17-CxxC domain-containing protein
MNDTNEPVSSPNAVERPDMVLLAATNFRNQPRRFGIKRDDRRRHMYLLGKTGMGKSTVLENMIFQDIANGEGIAVVDPHGDLAEKIIEYIPDHRVNDVIYFNPADSEFPIAFNIMESTSEEHKHLIASGMVGVFKKLWADSWGPRLEYVLRNSILALLDYPGSTMLGVMRILVDKNYRARVVKKVKDPVVRSFWLDEYSKYPPALQAEATAPIQNKVGQFLSSAMIRNIVGQSQSTIDIRKAMDERKILIMNLSKGRIGEDSSALMGAMMITRIQLAAMSRIDTPEKDRTDFYLYVDEFQNFATESFANILSEARKYRLNLIVGHQYIEQLDETVCAAIFGNVGTLMIFRVGSADATFLETEFDPYFTPGDLVNLAKYDVYMKLMIDGISSNPFSAKTLPPLDLIAASESNRQKVIQVSRERYARPKDVVEDKITRWSMNGGDEEDVPPEETAAEEPLGITVTIPPVETPEKPAVESPSVAPAAPRPPERKPAPTSRPAPKEKESYMVDCYECGDPTEIHFKPDGIRPVYCPKCFKKIREKVLHPATSAAESVPAEPEPPAPELSLSDALRQAPVSFDGPKNSPRPRSAAPTPAPAFRIPLAQPKPAAPAPTAPKSTGPTRLSPGQVVKF